MQIFFSNDQFAHAPASEINRGEIGSPFERPERASSVLQAIERAGMGPAAPAQAFDDEAILRIHDAAYVAFLQSAHAEWRALQRHGPALANTWAVRGMRGDRVPTSLDGRLAHYSFDVMTPLDDGTWVAARASAHTALTAAASVASGDTAAAFALCRPPGHHASADCYGGYSYLNNAAIAAQYLRDRGARRVAIFDVDYHHGNGTQSIFYDRGDVLYLSIHADPATDFPYFLGFADETGAGAGTGATHNFPLPRGCTAGAWFAAFEEATVRLKQFAPDALVVSLGVDTASSDPLSHFQLETPDFERLGTSLAALGLPTTIIFEGGYEVARIGGDVVTVLRAFDARREA